MSLNRCDSPPRLSGRIWVTRVTDTTNHQFTILSEKVHGYLTHWTGETTIKCLNHDEECPSCKVGKFPQRWKGYLHVRDEAKDQEVFLEIPPNGFPEFKIRTDNGQSLRGKRFTCHRTKGGPKGKLVVQFLAVDWNNKATLPKAIDPEATLLQLWNHGARRGE